MHTLFFITGASGAGKTTAIQQLEALHPSDFAYCYSDALGVLSHAEMLEKYGCPEACQQAETEWWTQKILREYLPQRSTILDKQTRLAFITDACRKFDVANYTIILFDCSDEVRQRRLIARGQPELASETMLNWSRFLRNEAKANGGVILDTTSLTESETAAELLDILHFKHC